MAFSNFNPDYDDDDDNDDDTILLRTYILLGGTQREVS